MVTGYLRINLDEILLYRTAFSLPSDLAIGTLAVLYVALGRFLSPPFSVAAISYIRLMMWFSVWLGTIEGIYGNILDIVTSGCYTVVTVIFVLGYFIGCLSSGVLLTEEVSLHEPSPAKPFRQGLVQIFTGDGKGKTSAALGAVFRAVGHGLKVFIVFFMKGDYPYGEFGTLSKLPNVGVASFGFRRFIDRAHIRPEEIEQAKLALSTARQAMLSGDYDLVVLDEVNVAAAWELVGLDEVVSLIRDKPSNVELILTGRYADAELIKLADLVTEMVKVKHPYDKGVLARRGIEY